MRTNTVIILSVLLVFNQCKKQTSNFILEDGIYDWESSYINNKTITPDSVKNYFSIKVTSGKIKFYENEKRILNGVIESVISDSDYSSNCSQGHSYKINISGSTFYIKKCNLWTNYFYINSFPYGYYNTNYNNTNLDPNRFYKPEFLGNNKFVKRP